MKKTAIFLIMVFAATLTFAQCKQKVLSAFNYTNNGYLDKAQKCIDEASICDETKSWAKTWFYKGNVYYEIYVSKEEKYKKLDSNALQIAYDSYQKAFELDTKKEFYEYLMKGLYNCSNQFYNKGVEMYNLKRYDEAMSNFDKTAAINAIFQITDTSATYNAALCSELAKNPDKAKDYYIKLVKANYHQPLIYASLANIYTNKKDTASALSTIKKGRKIYPDNYNLIIAETNIYLTSGKSKEAKDLLELAIQKDPSNPNLYYAIGTSFDALSNDTSKAATDRDSYFTEAETAYKKAIDLKANYFDAIYNLGALYFNDGVRIFLEADKDPNDMTKYGKLKPIFEARFASALPYLEKAYELDPNDYNTLLSLKQLYAKTNQTDKYKVINEKLKALNK
jgi:tetratricopeptide (TPR) repeat protein